ncbi:MAG TPA: hypothetical protein VG324_25380, partial [Blastocatellia bacterium]|nr:hypothetical protein [Blastocatellia bacterium]
RRQEFAESLALGGSKSCGRQAPPSGRCQVPVVLVFCGKLFFFRDRPVGCFNRRLNRHDTFRKTLIAIGCAIPFHQCSALLNQFRP